MEGDVAWFDCCVVSTAGAAGEGCRQLHRSPEETLLGLGGIGGGWVSISTSAVPHYRVMEEGAAWFDCCVVSTAGATRGPEETLWGLGGGS